MYDITSPKQMPWLRKKWSQNGSPTIAPPLEPFHDTIITQLHPWHYFGTTFRGGAIFGQIYDYQWEKTAQSGTAFQNGSRIETFWLHFFLSVLLLSGTMCLAHQLYKSTLSYLIVEMKLELW